MTEVFDEYRDNYRDVVQESIDFSSLEHAFFMRAKQRIFFDILARHHNSKPTLEMNYLDLGCGVGAFLPYVQDRFKTTDGCDISTQSIAKAKEQNTHARFTAYGGEKLPYEDGSFDVLTTICVVHHVPPQQWPSFFAEMHRVLKPGGLACVIEHNPLNPLTRLAVSRCEFDEDAVLLTQWKTAKLFKQAGFQRSQTEHFLFLPFEKKAVAAFENMISKLPLGAQYVSFARK